MSGRAGRSEQGQAIVRGAAALRRPTCAARACVYGRVLRAPASPELVSTLRSANEAAARAVPGFVALVRDALLLQGGSAGPGHRRRARPARSTASKPRWPAHGRSRRPSSRPTIDAAIDIDRRLAARRALRAPAARRPDRRRDAPGTWTCASTCRWPRTRRSSRAPRWPSSTPTARLQLWVGSQDVFYQRDVMAKRLGLAEAAGGRARPARRRRLRRQDASARWSWKPPCWPAPCGAPVKVQWTRAQEFQLGFHRPPSSHRIRARLQDGRCSDWWHAFASSHILFTNAAVPPWLQRLTDVIGDDGVARGATLPYRAAARRTEFDAGAPAGATPARGAAWAPGPNVFAIESRDRRVRARRRRRPGALPPGPHRRPAPGARAAARGRGRRLGRARARRRPTAHGAGAAWPAASTRPMSYAAVVADVEVDIATARCA